MQRLRRLLRRRALREVEGVFVAEGVRVVREALASGAEVESLYFSQGSRAGGELAELAAAGVQRGARVFDLAAGVMERVADTVTPQPVLAVVKRGDVGLSALRGATMVLVLAGVSDPGNAGTLLRAALGAGADAAVFSASCVDPYNPKTVRASAGALFRLPLVVGPDPVEAARWLAGEGIAPVGAVARGGRDYVDADWKRPFALFVGNEAHGVVSELELCFDELVSIPLPAQVESLNVAMAASVICFEAARQRRAAVPAP